MSASTFQSLRPGATIYSWKLEFTPEFNLHIIEHKVTQVQYSSATLTLKDGEVVGEDRIGTGEWWPEGFTYLNSETQRKQWAEKPYQNLYTSKSDAWKDFMQWAFVEEKISLRLGGVQLTIEPYGYHREINIRHEKENT